MTKRIRLLAVLVYLVATAPLQAADPPAEIANLFPAGTLAYIEVHNPAELAPQIASVFKGTTLEDSISFIHGRRDSATTLMELTGKRELAWLGLLTSPEMAGEFKKLRVAAALTGFTENGDPEFVLVVLTHDSPAAGLAARAYLTLTPTLRRVGEVAKVAVFQHRTPDISYDNNGVPTVRNDKPTPDGPHEPTYAYTPGLLVVGTSKTAVGHALLRFSGQEKTGLAGKPEFKTAAAAHRQTGLFYFVNFPEFITKFENANRNRGAIRGVEELLLRGLEGSDLLAWFKLTANPKAVTSVAGCVRFRDGGLAVSMAATIDPTQKCPLLDFLSGPGVKLELLHHAPRPASLAFAITLPEKNRAAVVISFLDAIAKADGQLGRLPGEAVRELEQKYKISIAEGLIGKTRAVTVFMPTKQELPKDGKPLPVFVFHTEDAATATAWEEFIPKLVMDLSNAKEVPSPASETIVGIKVFSLPGAGLPWNSPVHYARKGNSLAVGLDRKLVAAAVAVSPANSVANGDNPLSLPGEPCSALGVLSLGNLLIRLIEPPAVDGPVVPREDPVPILPNGNPVPESVLAAIKKGRKDFLMTLESMPLATVIARRSGNELQIEVFQPKVQGGGLKPVIDAGANWLDRWGALTGTRRNGGFEEREVLGKW